MPSNRSIALPCVLHKVYEHATIPLNPESASETWHIAEETGATFDRLAPPRGGQSGRVLGSPPASILPLFLFTATPLLPIFPFSETLSGFKGRGQHHSSPPIANPVPKVLLPYPKMMECRKSRKKFASTGNRTRVIPNQSIRGF